MTTVTKEPCPTVTASCALLGQCRTFLQSIDTDHYTTPSQRLMGSTIGQHVRHSLDHYAAALSALEGRIIDYDHRARKTPIESECTAAIAQIDTLSSQIESLAADAMASDVTIRVMLSAEGETADLRSTLAREFAFATHHAIHHCAMMASIASELGQSIPEGFGKAPSTRNYERTGA